MGSMLESNDESFDSGIPLKERIEEHLRERMGTIRSFCFSFVGFHYAYIIGMSLILSWILYPLKNMSYTDSLYLAVSTCTNTGMAPIAGNDLAVYQQVFLIFFSLFTNHLVINTAIVFFRISLYEKQFDNIKSRSRMQSKARRVATKERTRTLKSQGKTENLPSRNVGDLVRSLNLMQMRAREPREPRELSRAPTNESNACDFDEGEGPAIVVRSPMEMEHDIASTCAASDVQSLDEGEGPPLVIRSPMDIEKETEEGQDQAIQFTELPRPRRNDSVAQGRNSFSRPPTRNSFSRTRSMTGNYLSYAPTVTGSTFVNLTQEQKDELGGVEYRAIRLLAVILVCYYFGFLLLSFVTLAPWCQFQSYYRDKFLAEGYSPAWNGIFMGASAFQNYGYTISPQGLTMFSQNVYVPLWSGLFILAGNVAQPIFLRFIIWCLFNIVPVEGAARESLGFLLDHPRRCFLLLFPSKATWMLLLVVVSLNTIDVVIFLAIEFHASVVRELPPGYRFLDGLYQAICLRTVGFNIMNIGEIRPSVQVAYIAMMYISIFPVAISVRNTNVYEEQTLGVWGEDDTQSVVTSTTGAPKRPKKVSTHLQRQLAHDLWFLTIGLFLISICEDGKIESGATTFLSILFEAVSSYACVGVSTGYVGVAYSLGGNFTVVSKLVLCVLMIRGRHRGLPYKLDRAIMLNRDNINTHDEIQEQWGRELQSLMPSEAGQATNWLERVNTNVSRLRRSATRVSGFSARSHESEVSRTQAFRRRAKSFNFA